MARVSCASGAGKKPPKIGGHHRQAQRNIVERPPANATQLFFFELQQELTHFAREVLRNLIERLQFLSNSGARSAARPLLSTKARYPIHSWIEASGPPWARATAQKIAASHARTLGPRGALVLPFEQVARVLAHLQRLLAIEVGWQAGRDLTSEPMQPCEAV
jgi:hypothetical protein